MGLSTTLGGPEQSPGRFSPKEKNRARITWAIEAYVTTLLALAYGLLVVNRIGQDAEVLPTTHTLTSFLIIFNININNDMREYGRFSVMFEIMFPYYT